MATRATRRRKVPKYMTGSTYSIENARAYAASLSPADRMDHIKNIVSGAVRFGEQTEAHVFARAEMSGYEAHDVHEAIGELLDEGKVRSTIIDGKEFGFLPGLVGNR